MKRPQRNLLIIMSVMVGFYLLVTRLPWPTGLAIAGAALIAFFSLAVWGRDYYLARRHVRRREWRQAVDRYRRFEQRLLRARWPHAGVVLYLGIYTFDGVAVARNNIGQALLEEGDLDGAVLWLRSALQRDVLYPTPYVHLGVIAAMRDDETGARRELSRAVELGYSPVAAQRALNEALARRERGM